MRRKKAQIKNMAKKRVIHLVDLAEKSFKTDPLLSDRYIRLAWKIKTKFNLQIPRELKLKFCKKCLKFWQPGVTCRVRARGGVLTITCLGCGWVYRIPFKKRG